MQLTRVLLFYVKRRKIPGRLDLGKHQLVKPVTLDLKKKAVTQLLHEKLNLAYLENPYLNEEEEKHLNEIEYRQELALMEKERDEQIRKKMIKPVTIVEHLVYETSRSNYGKVVSMKEKLDIEPIPPANSKLQGVVEWPLYNGARFEGHQKSKGSSYDVEVILHHVDMENSYLCGYLKIIGLTEDYPILTTFFDGEIISRKYPFLTRKWEADEDVDRKHWSQFSHFAKYSQTFNSDDFDYNQLKNRNHVFMRWKAPECYVFYLRLVANDNDDDEADDDDDEEDDDEEEDEEEVDDGENEVHV
ncbi:hypothetical protein HELRODRAFT_194499 [Helobdella robusta]|uniref:Uncharacterized protein n=1 Tax=Helobdella robusta TaxID=6412 RepID=T1FW46_HELRO|nr:hypothetical protein HELRODRAFT_194499 [Helobdella robusta]ESN91867.1 hypothetical protein HELRODRAFT_194499 [Helobdella robusta]